MSGSDGLRFWPLTDVGKVRDHNEDSFLVDRKLNLFVVCDGMGGHAAGEVASSMTARVVRETLAEEQDVLLSYEQGNDSSRQSILELMEKASQRACSAVHQEGVRDESKRGMGTTLVALAIVGNRGFICHVGDSRIYLYRQGAVHQLTEDHSLINELLKRGRLTREQIAKMNYKNAVTRAVGVYESVDADVFDFDVLPGDRFLLCSDGLHDYLEESVLARLIEETPEDDLARRLVQLANDGGGKDNITALVVRVPDDTSGVEKVQEVNLKLEMLHKMPLFRFVTYQELVRVVNITDVKTYAAGQTVVTEGDEGEEMFLVLSGRVRIHTGDTLIAHLGPGQHLGEMSLIDKAPRSASVTAEEESRLLIIGRRGFFDLVRKNHDIAVKLLWSFLGVLNQRLRTTSRELGETRDELHRVLMARAAPPPPVPPAAGAKAPAPAPTAATAAAPPAAAAPASAPAGAPGDAPVSSSLPLPPLPRLVPPPKKPGTD